MINKNVEMKVLNYVVAMFYVMGFLIIYGGIDKAFEFGLDWSNGITIVLGIYTEYAAFLFYKKRIKEINENSVDS